jgi:amylosucrase
MRICGTMASLAGLEQAVERDDPGLIANAEARIMAMYSVVLSAGGIPLIYLGDEVATLNDYSFRDDPQTAGDARWVHRPVAQAERYAQRHDVTTSAGRIYQALAHLIRLRRQQPELADGETAWLDSGNRHVLAYTRHNALLALVNFSDHVEAVQRDRFDSLPLTHGPLRDLIADRVLAETEPITLTPYQAMWFVPAR